MTVNKKPIVGVTPLVDYQRESLWMLPGYFEGIEQAGGVPFMLPLETNEDTLEQLVDMCNALLITGGQDVSGEVYGCSAADSKLIGEISPERDAQERTLIKLAMDREIPILGICRGIQIINSVLGGTLWQDLPTQHPSKTTHFGGKQHDAPAHKVTVLENTPLAAYIGDGELAVNSYHHQAIKDLAPSLDAMAISEDGLVEAVWCPTKYFLWGIQWHPEFSFKIDDASRKIFEAFIGATVPFELEWVSQAH